MANAYDYIFMRGDLTFEQDPVNEVDIFICSQIATPDYKHIISRSGKALTVAEASKKYFRTHTTSVTNLGVLQSKYLLPMFEEMGKSKRFGDVTVFGYVNRIYQEENEQFSAVTLRLDADTLCVSFRGTDDTIVGWRENFNLAVYDEVPAQRDAAEYLKWIAENHEGDIIVTGHSKGGNLAIYAASKIPDEVKNRVSRVYSFDGPGFRDVFLNDEGYLKIKDRVSTVRSQNTIVGLLLNTAGADHTIVHTDVRGPMAHDGFNWDIKGNAFIREKQLSPLSTALDKALDETIKSLSDEERKEFTSLLFDAVSSTGATTLSELKESHLVELLAILLNLGTNRKVMDFIIKLIRLTEKYKKEQ